MSSRNQNTSSGGGDQDALLRKQWQAVDKVLGTHDPRWVDQEIGEKAGQRERMRRALLAAGLLAEAGSRTLNPMDGCPDCEWVDDETLGQMCALHEAIRALQEDARVEREIRRGLTSILSQVTLALGGDEHDDPVELAKARMEEILAYEHEAAAPES